ncbi:BadF/BadG/BcrA/BcrD ATPase family protein [Microbacterium sp. WCS2018Hpa-9]|uniref:N-acetylglucosamine kinase n=1 Tax=Microbacterium sp. WCS2018Hpa-9 TaxID=3073635 RepID=UPI00288B5D7F|nr:BadF/BadG/BcrA/BcrD ATPase family protein [Microbacterium sp. WCS2018Hpa-9]
MSSPRALVAVDLGKSRCRAVISGPWGADDRVPHRRDVYDGIGAPGLAAADGVAAALAAILPLRERLAEPISAVSVGAAGAWAAPAAAAELAHGLARELRAPVVVTSDVVSAHAGALDGGAGVLLIAGTGAAALGIDGEVSTLVDGWGPELGDFGSGSWFGREALRAVLRASAGLAPATLLTDAVAATIGDPAAIPGWLSADGPLARRLAALAPLVLDAAEGGDPVSAEIVADGIHLLVASAVAASSGSSDVALHGGLTAHLWFRSALDQALRAASHAVAVSAGDALDGALLLAERTDLPHERFVHRAE